MTSGIIEPYIWGYLITLNIMLAWCATLLKVHLLKVWLKLRRKEKDIFTPDEFDNYVGDNWGIFGELLVCPICLTHWVGAAVSAIFVLFPVTALGGADPIIIPLCFFSYPALVYCVLKKLIY